VEHPDLQLNLGNALARAGRLAEAALAFERALFLAPGDSDARLNLAAVRAKLAPQTSADPAAEASTLVEVIEPVVAPLPADAFAIAFAAAWTAIFALLAIRRLAPRLRSKAGVALVPAVLAMFGLGVVVVGQELVRREDRAVMMKSSSLKEGPDDRFGKVIDVPAGARVRVRKEEGGWLEVQDTGGRVGWIKGSDAARVARSS
jgi:hypothetical protein